MAEEAKCMLLNEKTVSRMKKLNLNVFVVDIDNGTVQTFEEWATENVALFTNTNEIGDITEYAVVADNPETARVLAYAKYYEYATHMFIEDMDDDDFEEVTSDSIPRIPTKEG
jgi:hypothetical protein